MSVVSGSIKAPRGLRLGALLFVGLAAGYAAAAPAVGDSRPLGAPRVSRSPGGPREVTVGRDGHRFRAVLIEIPAAGGGVQPIFLVEPRRPSKPKRAFLLFGGGVGRVSHVVRLEKGRYRLSRNFLMRIVKEIADAGIAAVPVGVWSGLTDSNADDFRLGTDHAKDMAAAVRALAARGYREVFIVGTSRGTMDAANLALNLKDPRVKGVIFTSTMGDNDGLIALPVEKIDLPVLFVHNLYDECHVTTYEGARELYARMKNSPRRRFVTVKAAAIAEGRECGAIAAHGFRDFESATARILTDWAKGRNTPSEISR
jgi:hypothetical protein